VGDLALPLSENFSQGEAEFQGTVQKKSSGGATPGDVFSDEGKRGVPPTPEGQLKGSRRRRRNFINLRKENKTASLGEITPLQLRVIGGQDD